MPQSQPRDQPGAENAGGFIFYLLAPVDGRVVLLHRTTKCQRNPAPVWRNMWSGYSKRWRRVSCPPHLLYRRRLDARKPERMARLKNDMAIKWRPKEEYEAKIVEIQGKLAALQDTRG